MSIHLDSYMAPVGNIIYIFVKIETINNFHFLSPFSPCSNNYLCSLGVGERQRGKGKKSGTFYFRKRFNFF